MKIKDKTRWDKIGEEKSAFLQIYSDEAQHKLFLYGLKFEFHHQAAQYASTSLNFWNVCNFFNKHI